MKIAATLVAVPALLLAGFLAGCGARQSGVGSPAATSDTRMVTVKVVLPSGKTRSTIATITTPKKIWKGVATTDALP
jgi:hypothetical protein